MSSIPPIPPTVESLGNRPFSFYPPVLNIEHNEWHYRRASWSEMLVVNARTGQELWIPRRFLGEVSRIDEPVVIVGLNKELEFKAGSVWPHQRRVIEMPVAVGARRSPPVESRPSPASIIGIRLEGQTERKVGRLLAGVMVLIAVGGLTLVMVTREGTPRQRLSYSNLDQKFLELRNTDDYTGIVSKLGRPAEDRSREAAGDIFYRALWYPERSYTVVLMGGNKNELHYIGTLDKDWNVIHSTPLAGGADTGSILRSLKQRRF